MFTTIKQFKELWKKESNNTKKIFSVLTDDSLSKKVADDHRTLGRMAWHIVTTFPEMMKYIGLKAKELDVNDPVPKSAKEIINTYEKISSEFSEQITKNWNDDTLQVEDDMYGEKYKRGDSLYMLLCHEIHHRAQMTVLMRQAGLKVPGIYGPSKEEWSKYGMKEPEV